MSAPMKSSDPAYWMLERGRNDPSQRSVATAPHRDGCYICEDPEFSLMGLPLCYACPYCKGHVAADDTKCDDCGKDASEAPCPVCHDEPMDCSGPGMPSPAMAMPCEGCGVKRW
jgi:hypothetical protein